MNISKFYGKSDYSQKEGEVLLEKRAKIGWLTRLPRVERFVKMANWYPAFKFDAGHFEDRVEHHGCSDMLVPRSEAHSVGI
jgi:hypothetical protein